MSGIRERKKKETRQAILQAAIELFAKKGFEQTSVSELAIKAGVGKGTIYGYFQTKNEIFLAFCEDEIEHAFGSLKSRCDADSPLIDRLLVLFVEQFRFVTRNPDFGRLLAREMVFPKELTVDKSKDLDNRYLEVMGTILSEAAERGELSRDIDHFFATAHLYSLYIMVLSGWYMGRLKSDEDVEGALHLLLEQALHGLGAKQGQVSGGSDEQR